MKLKKRRKSRKMYGKGMGSHGWGARKKHKGSGHRGGFGMAGGGKRAYHKKFQRIVEYNNKYFGKSGFTSRSTKKKKTQIINLIDLTNRLEYFKKNLSDGKGIIDLRSIRYWVMVM